MAGIVKRSIAALLAASALGAFAAVDVNRATQAELETVKGIGPGMSARILDERKHKGSFKDWADFVARVKGVGASAATKLSADGLRVDGAPYPQERAASAATR